jgi:effector-binding domain-containing protein
MKKTLTLILVLMVAAAFTFAADEKAPVAPAQPGKATMKGEIKWMRLPAMICGTVMEKASDYTPKDGYKPGPEGTSQAYGSMMMKGFEKLGTWQGANKVKATGPHFAIFYEDPMSTPAEKLTCKVGVPVTKAAEGSDVVKIETVPAQEAAVVQYLGPYDGSMEIWMALGKWVKERGYVPAGPPMEMYLKGPKDTQKPEEYLTEIRQPVKKAETKPEEKKEGKTDTKVKEQKAEEQK